MHRTKPELAWDLIRGAEADSITFGWGGIDAGCGRDQNLLVKISGLGKKFVADVDCDQQVWLEQPQEEQRPNFPRSV